VSTVLCVLRVETDLEEHLARLEGGLDEDQVDSGQPRRDGRRALREDDQPVHEGVSRQAACGQRAERPEADVVLVDRALDKLGIRQRDEGVLLACRWRGARREGVRGARAARSPLSTAAYGPHALRRRRTSQLLR
jgi:hypothetical protein